MRDQEIQRLFPNLEGHNGPFAVEPALAGEAVGAVQVAGMRHMKAQRLDDARRPLLQLPGHRREGIAGKQFPLFLQLRDLIIAFRQLRRAFPEAPRHFRDQRVPALFLIGADHFIRDFVHRMDAAGAGVHHDIPVIQMKTMNHMINSVIRSPLPILAALRLQ